MPHRSDRSTVATMIIRAPAPNPTRTAPWRTIARWGRPMPLGCPPARHRAAARPASQQVHRCHRAEREALGWWSPSSGGWGGRSRSRPIAGASLRQAAPALGYLTAAEFDAWVRPEDMTRRMRW